MYIYTHMEIMKLLFWICLHICVHTSIYMLTQNYWKEFRICICTCFEKQWVVKHLTFCKFLVCYLFLNQVVFKLRTIEMFSEISKSPSYCWCFRNPAPVDMVNINIEFTTWTVVSYGTNVVKYASHIHVQQILFTLPEANIAPENRPSQKETVFQPFSGANC